MHAPVEEPLSQLSGFERADIFKGQAFQPFLVLSIILVFAAGLARHVLHDAAGQDVFAAGDGETQGLAPRLQVHTRQRLGTAVV